MDSFQKTIIYVGLVLLIITLLVIFMMLYYSSSNQEFPPIISKCPDFFIINNDGLCENKANLGNGSSWDRHPIETSTKQQLCTYRNTLNQKGLTWDGITNNPDVCNFD